MNNQQYKYKTKIPKVYGWSQTKCKLRVIQTIYAQYRNTDIVS